MNSRGIVAFARNNSQVDYIKQAVFLAKRARQYLDLPTTLITDSPEYLKAEYPDYKEIFDKVIFLVWQEQDLTENTVMCNKELNSVKKFHDGALVVKRLDWKNETRTLAYDVSPYDETLLLDTDIVISNKDWLKCFKQPHDLLAYSNCVELLEIDRGNVFQRISDTSVDFYWATAIFFRKTEANKILFDLQQHIQENWQHYCAIFQINTPYYRNDYAFSIAVHIMNGYESGNFVKPMPGNLYFITDKSVLWDVNKESMLILLEKPTYDGEYTPLRIKNATLHCMNKFSLNRCIDNA
jgi:hypothetical protein